VEKEVQGAISWKHSVFSSFVRFMVRPSFSFCLLCFVPLVSFVLFVGSRLCNLDDGVTMALQQKSNGTWVAKNECGAFQY
jgi:hypothetical protein